MLAISSQGGRGLGVSNGSRAISRGVASAALSPAQALVASFAGTGLLDALLLFDPAYYSTPGSTPGVLVDALGGPVAYTAPNTQATPTAVPDASGYWYARADGIDDTLLANANQSVAYYCVVLRSVPGQTAWNTYGAPVERISSSAGRRLGFCNSGNTQMRACRGVRRNGQTITPDANAFFDLAPITSWILVSVSTGGANVSQFLQMFALEDNYFLSAHIAALAIRYTDPTTDQQAQIEAKLASVRAALLGIVNYPVTLRATNAAGTGTQTFILSVSR